MPGNEERAAASAAGMPASTSGARIGWRAVPADVRARIGRLLGGTVVRAVGQPGGFSEGLAARVVLADGRRAFVKAASTAAAPAAAAFHRREIQIASRLPAGVPAPRFLDACDDGVWVALAFEEIDGRLPAQPWRRDELDRVLAALGDLAALLTPSPLPPHVLAAPRLGGWRALTGDPTAAARLAGIAPWAAGRLEELAALEQDAWPHVAGTTLQHGDLYPFNIMLAGERVVVIDWPHAWIGAPHCDALTLMSNAALSGLSPQELADTHPLTRDLPSDRLNAFLTLHSGFLLRMAATAGRSADPALVRMLTALGRASLDWLCDRW